MDLYYSGTIEFTRPLTEQEKADIREIFEYAGRYLGFDKTNEAYISTDGKSLEFNAFETNDLYSEFSDLARAVKEWPDIEIVEGCSVDYTGDYEGAAVFEDGEYTERSEDECVIREATDDDLLAELERRGLSMPGSEEEEEEKELAKSAIKKEPVKIKIVVEEGMIQTVYSTDKDVDIEVIDLDTDDEDEQDEAEEALSEVEDDDSYVEVW